MRQLRALLLVFLLATTPAMAAPATDNTSRQKAVLVTGASSGIGLAITEHLAAAGHFVYAGARKEEDLNALAKIKNVQPLKLDVTRPADIAAAVETVTKAGRGLYALVNNAGVVTLGPLPTMKPEEFDLMFEVNVRGPFLMTRAFTPLIAAEKGRITTIGSISGILAGRSAGAYSMSKHALEAFGDSLAADLEPQGVTVSLVEPGSFRSNIDKKAIERTGNSEYARLGVTPEMASRSTLKEPDAVAEAVLDALFSANPKRRYLVVPNQNEAEITLRKQIAQLVELNEGHAYTYDREALVRMLDEALKSGRQRRN